jgi:CRISPR-associated endonuclease/helicase Cas3
MSHAEILEKHFGFKPYDYQLRVAQALLEGKNVILRAPTGSGKTEAALAPFIIARETQHPSFPLKTMLASPMKTLAKSIHDRAQKVTRALNLDVRLHTGEDQGAPLLEGDVVVTTIDQLISNYAHIPLSMSNGRANIGAGAVISSYIVFDEFHLLDPKRAFQTALLMIEQLRGIAPFLLMTATLSSEMIAELETVCQAVVIEPTSKELAQMPSQQKTRNFTREKEQLTAQKVVQHHQRRSLVILNTVARAQAMAADLTALKPANTRIELIHSQFMPSDRAAKELQLETWMGEKSTENIILVATQAIEVGINISSEHLHTELCPANSLLQRAGRCARFKGETGTVHIYDLPLDDLGKKRIMPYKELVVELEATWAALEGIQNPVGFAEEAKLINTVHTTRDLGYLQAAKASKVGHLEKLCKAQGSLDRAMASSLIREVISQSVILHPNPEEMRTWKDVSKCEMVGLFPGKLNSVLVPRTDENGEIEEWIAKVPREEGEEYESRIYTVLKWDTTIDPNRIRLAPLVVLNPKYVHYSPEFGLRPDILEPSDGKFPRLKKSADIGERQDWWYTFETYREHIENVINALPREAADILRTCQKVDAKFKLPLGTLEQAIRIAIAAHDIGKLSTGWQTWTRNWQIQQLEAYPDLLWNGLEGQRRVVPQPKGMYCAHTDYHPEHDKESTKKQPKRPGHAGESASVLEKVFYERYLGKIGNDELGAQIFCGIYGAIARHHGACNTGKTESWKLDASSSQEIQNVFLDLTKDLLDIDELRKLEQKSVPIAEPIDFMPQPTELLAWLSYTLISRALRQSDSHSFIRHEVKEDNEN